MATKKSWVRVPQKPSKSQVPDSLKEEVQKKAEELVHSFLKPNFIKEPPKGTQWNYIVDIYTKWYRNYFYFCSKYHCPSPNAMTDYFESKFARLEYVGDRKFNVAYMRHTEQWWEILQGLTLEECFEEIRQQELLHP